MPKHPIITPCSLLPYQPISNISLVNPPPPPCFPLRQALDVQTRDQASGGSAGVLRPGLRGVRVLRGDLHHRGRAANHLLARVRLYQGDVAPCFFLPPLPDLPSDLITIPSYSPVFDYTKVSIWLYPRPTLVLPRTDLVPN